MLDFIRTLLSSKERNLTVMLLKDNDPEQPQTFWLKPKNLLYLVYTLIAATVLFVLALIYFTPLGSVVGEVQNEELEQSVQQIQKKMMRLQDSLKVRDQQLSEIQTVLKQGQDTTFSVNYSEQAQKMFESNTSGSEMSMQTREINAYETVSQEDMMFSQLLDKAPEFPVDYPTQGTMTRGFQPDARHFGIDIAAAEGSEIRAIADGIVINSDWTINYGFVIHLQHANGITSVYKHCSNVMKQEGDIVLKNDILGSIGHTGVMSSGPHVHLELWQNGIPLNPIMYLTKN